jgi:hypothetical protein
MEMKVTKDGVRFVDRDWTVGECMQVMADIHYLETEGHWEDGPPEWARELAHELNTFVGSVSVLIIAYQKCATTFLTHIILTWRRDRDYVPGPADSLVPYEQR